MTIEELYKYHWKYLEVVEFVNPRTKEVIQCNVLAVDFDCCVMKLVPCNNLGYEEKEFWCSTDVIRKIIKNQKLKVS